MDPSPNGPPAGELTPPGCLMRLVWMGFGNAALVFATLHVAMGSDVRKATAIFVGVVALLGLARALDVLRFGGLTTNGLPATSLHLRRYLVGLTFVSAILWGVAHAARGVP